MLVASSCGDIYGVPTYGDLKLDIVYYGSGISGFDNIAGGGMIIIECNNHFENNGEIKCNGDNGCSGGSILIIVQGRFVNQGTIEALGGDGESPVMTGEYWCGGGLGRIAIYSCNNTKDNQNIGNIDPSPYWGNYKDAKFEIMT